MGLPHRIPKEQLNHFKISCEYANPEILTFFLNDILGDENLTPVFLSKCGFILTPLPCNKGKLNPLLSLFFGKGEKSPFSTLFYIYFCEGLHEFG